MARRVFYRISDRPDGCFDAVVTIEPDTVVCRAGFRSLVDVEEWIDGLRVLMAALGAPVAQADGMDAQADVPMEPDPIGLRTVR